MSEPDKALNDLVKRALGPTGSRELQRDLWPRMLARLEEPPIRAPWWDWALAAAIVLCLLLCPAAIPAVLYHL
jgi:hypothetical protein